MEMKDKRYETLFFGDKPLPFIFHRDMRRYDSSMETNWHPDIELLCFNEGEGRVSCGTQSFEVSAGDIAVINSNLAHIITAEKYVRYCCLIVDDKYCREVGIDTESLSFLPLVRDGQARELFEQVISEYDQDRSYKNAGIRLAVLSLMVYLARNFSERAVKDTDRPRTKDESIELVIGYIKSHINEKMTVEGLAYEAGLSKFYFLREFKKVTGETPISYINRTRCENARKMLKGGRYRLKEVSERNGFENVSYFSKLFKRYIGENPAEYMKRHADKP